ncbi:T9SS type A sorting domain-containing protein [Cryomorpha ignava]|uniref:T9SS type A sorting domain-containing protein n=1 Tax=Cryomorpha ignava TaxID=101383 RepID=A0A7K3WUC0_9FLAO|nr:T9SS type A sorting domain-containing protein [Cryomorpha ignava]NEN24255.1 T9SS type A sorting domain-containing protein [Cryomorpha ignava]
MAKHLLKFLLVTLPVSIFAQDLELLTPLSSTISESSGLIYLNGKLITHSDSGGEARLYEIDSLTGNVLRTVAVLNAINKDWEDLAHDNTYIYIGDFGNNNGVRTDLKVYRILQSDYFESDNDQATAEAISFNYSDQTDFTSAPFSTNFDAEAFISYQDSLYIFTKNWGDNRTNVYPLSKLPGNYALNRTDSMDAQGMITGAAINENTGRLILSGYSLISPFAIIISSFPEGQFSQGITEHIDLQAPSGYSYQIEGVSEINPGLFYFTSEGGFLGNSGLFKLNLNLTGIAKTEKEEFTISPNPATDYFTVNTSGKIKLKLFNSAGDLVQVEDSNRMDVSSLSRGIYLLEIRGSGNKIIATKRIVLN